MATFNDTIKHTGLPLKDILARFFMPMKIKLGQAIRLLAFTVTNSLIIDIEIKLLKDEKHSRYNPIVGYER